MLSGAERLALGALDQRNGGRRMIDESSSCLQNKRGRQLILVDISRVPRKRNLAELSNAAALSPTRTWQSPEINNSTMRIFAFMVLLIDCLHSTPAIY